MEVQILAFRLNEIDPRLLHHLYLGTENYVESRYAPYVGNMNVNALNILVLKVLFGALEEVLI